MVDGTALEMRRRGNLFGGSNPSLSANNTHKPLITQGFIFCVHFYPCFNPRISGGWGGGQRRGRGPEHGYRHTRTLLTTSSGTIRPLRQVILLCHPVLKRDQSQERFHLIRGHGSPRQPT